MIPAILGLSGPTLTAEERAFFTEVEPAGFILFARNIVDREQLRALTDELRGLSGRADLPILVDQEGGRIARLGPPVWPAYPAPARFAALYQRAPISAMEAARVNALLIALDLNEAGITMNCAPSLDLLHEGAHGVIGDRSLGADPMQVAALGRAMLDGFAEGGVECVIKHMPGHGRARADSHDELPIIDADEEALEADLAPFRALRHAPAAMTAHILYRVWDNARPATLSPRVIEEIIRGRIGYEGLLISDDIAMDALEGSVGQRAQAAVAAGCDLVLHCSGRLEESREVAATLSSIAEAARDRLARATAVIKPAPPFDRAALTAKRDALLALA